MSLNADFSARVLIHTDQIAWAPSPMPGVDRRMLDRIGDEVARATTIVRYAPGSHFSAHTHTGGEEFIVLEGVFQDEHGDFPAGTYVRNPPTTRHTPRSAPGCVIFVKLWQFDMADRAQVRLDMGKAAQDTGSATLFEDARETVRYHALDAGAPLTADLPGGAELLVLDGILTESGDKLRRHSWLRLPAGSALDAKAGQNGAKIWMKTGHLPYAAAPQV